jgi:hypothetical protein
MAGSSNLLSQVFPVYAFCECFCIARATHVQLELEHLMRQPLLINQQKIYE